MKINHEKRMKVVANLRSITDDELSFMFLGEILNYAIGGYCLDDEGNIDERLVLKHLADLIDPRRETTEDVSESYGEFECKACGCRINDTTAVDYGGIYFCPDCGREVINDN